MINKFKRDNYKCFKHFILNLSATTLVEFYIILISGKNSGGIVRTTKSINMNGTYYLMKRVCKNNLD